MKKLITLMVLLLSAAAYSQGVNTLEINKVEKQTPIDSDTKLMVWDSLNYGKVKYTKIGDLIALFGGGGLSNPLTEDLNAGGYEINNVLGISTNGINVTGSGIFNTLSVDNLNVTGALNMNSNAIYGASLLTIKNPIGQDANVGNYYFGTLNGNLILRAVDGVNGSSTPVFTVNDETLQIGFGNYEFPRQDGTDGQVLTTDGSGQVSFQDAAGLWNHTATQDIDLNGNDVVMGTTSRMVFEGGAGVFSYDVVDSSLNYNEPIKAREFIKQDGIATQFLKADGSVDSNTYATIDQVPSSKITHRSFDTDSIEALPLADIKASKLIYSNVYRPNETPADTLYIEYPDLTLESIDSDETWAPTFGSENGQVISLIPAPGNTMNKKISLKQDVRGLHALIYKGGANFVESLSSSQFTFEDYTAPVSDVPILESFSHTEIATDATSVVATAPTGIQDDDILLMIVSLDENGVTNTVTSTGFTLLEDYDVSGSHKQVVLWKRASSESGNYTVSLTDAQDGSVSIARISGATTSGSPIDVEGTTNEVFAASITPNDITSTESNTLAISYTTVDRNYRVSGSSTVSGSGWTLISTPASYGADGIGFMWAQKDVSAAGSVGQPTFTFDSSDQAIGQTINIKS